MRDVKVSQVTATSVRVHWSPPSSTGGDLSHYTVSYEVTQMSNCPTEDMEWSPLHADIPPHQTTYEVSGLHPNSQYRVAVWAETAAGPGRKTINELTTLPSGETAGKVERQQSTLVVVCPVITGIHLSVSVHNERVFK